MKLSFPTALLSISAPAGAGTAVSSWRTGQQLTAWVLAQTGPQSVSLRVGNQTLEANTSVALPPRTSLQLEVVQGGAQPVLRIVNPTQPAVETLSAALRAAVPQQLPLRDVFATLYTLAAQGSSSRSTKPGLVPLAQWLAQLPAAGSLIDAAGVRRVLRDAGLFLENKLARGAKEELDGDLKGRLLKLLATLDEQHADARRLTGAALARIELNQLNALAQPAYAFEIPLRRDDGVDVVQLRIEREDTSADEQETKDWTVWIDFDMEPLGPVQAKLTLREEAVAALLWAERAQGAALINGHLPQLEQAFITAGLRVRQLQCLVGKPADRPFTVFTGRLVDVTA